MIDLRGELRRCERQRETVSGKLATQSAPNLPAIMTFVSGLYERAKADCISELYMASRARAFWGLESYRSFYDRLGRNPGRIDHAQLKAAATTITADLLAALERARRTPNRFPAGGRAEGSLGVVVVLNRVDHRQLFEDLEEDHEGEFELVPATPESRKPRSDFEPTWAAWCGATPPPPDDPNPFHGKADVRLTKVRAWMCGMRTSNGEHDVTLVHLGPERFCRPDGDLYPDSGYVTHAPTQIPFRYKAGNLGFDPLRPMPFTPGQLFGDVAGTEDGDLGFPALGGSELPEKSSYAPIGPFAKWRLIVRPQDNPGLDLSHLDWIVLDFHGYHQTFAL